MTSLPTIRDRSVAGQGWGVHLWLGVALPDRRAFAVLRRHVDVYFQLWRVNMVPAVYEPTIALLVMGLALGEFVDLRTDVDYIVFVAPGLMAMFAMFGSIADSLWGAFMRMEQQGAYSAILATPARAEDIAAGEILWGATRSAMTVTVVLVVLAVLSIPWGLIQSPLVVFTIPLAFLMGLLFASISIAYVGFTHSVHELMYFFTIVINPMFWFSGAFFPLDQLPGWAETIGWFNPLAHVVDLFRGLTFGEVGWAHAGDVAWLIAVTLPMAWLAIWSLRRRLIR